MSDLISRCELFNRLATIPAPPEANDFKAEIYKVIQGMETEQPHVVAQINLDKDLVVEEVMQRIKEEYQVELRRGKWEPVDMTCSHAHEFKCTVCGQSVYYDHYTRSCDYDYCPNCGAFMEGGEQ